MFRRNELQIQEFEYNILFKEASNTCYNVCLFVHFVDNYSKFLLQFHKSRTYARWIL